MPFAGSGGSLVTGANVVDGTLSGADFAAGTVEAYLPTCTELFPIPNSPFWITGNQPYNTNTTAHVGQVIIPEKIIVNNISISVAAFTAAGSVKIGLYSSNGQTLIFSVTTASISATGLVTTTLGAPVTVPAGVYYLVFVGVGTANGQLWTYGFGNSTADLLSNSISGQPILCGTLTVTASTLPTTFSPTAITAIDQNCLMCRLDN